jgi:hypothetical protein
VSIGWPSSSSSSLAAPSLLCKLCSSFHKVRRCSRLQRPTICRLLLLSCSTNASIAAVVFSLRSLTYVARKPYSSQAVVTTSALSSAFIELPSNSIILRNASMRSPILESDAPPNIVAALSVWIAAILTTCDSEVVYDRLRA